MNEIIKTQDEGMSKISTLLLRAAVIGLGILAVGLGFLILSEIYKGFDREFPSIGYVKYPIIGILSVTFLPYFAALHQTMRLLKLIDTNMAFSLSSVRALRRIKYCGYTISALLAILLPFVYLVAEVDDAPGLIIVATVIALAPMAVGVFAAVLEKLLQNAIAMKTENELTV